MIAAIATPPGKGGIGVIRLSGDGLDRLGQAVLSAHAEAGRICHRNFVDHAGEVIDSGIALRFAAPNSYTGEDVLELQGHGGPAVLARLLRRCQELGARLARPGEFTMRAFANGKLDLAQAEAVADLVNATTERAARLASASLRGALSDRANAVAARLTEARAQLEATIDFSDEDISPAEQGELDMQVLQIKEQLARLHEDCTRGAQLRNGVTVALIGAPNAGKSSLLNALSHADTAIVDPEPGTTRDLVTAHCEIGGVELCLHDTAGMRDTNSPVEREGMRRARAAAESADVVIQVEDVTAPGPRLPARLLVHNKIDLSGDEARATDTEVWLSVATGAGLDLLRERLAQLCGGAGEEPPFLARERHVAALATALDEISNASEQALLPEQRAEHLRLAHDAIGSITGAVSADDLLGEIFARFCIGK